MPVKIVKDNFGVTKDPFTKNDIQVQRYTFTNDNQMSVQVITLGATVTTIRVPDECGRIEDVVCGFDTVHGYQIPENPYFGATVGRVCNRIGNGKFPLNGIEVNVNRNFNNKHQLHGGFIGFDKVHWISHVDETNNTVIMTHISADGHEGYPGNLTANVHFKLTEDNCFHVNMFATTDKLTVVNMTNHSYFNLAGHDAGKEELYNHLVKIKADRITETDADSIPTGVLLDVEGTNYDVRTLGNLGDRMKKLPSGGYDDNFCVDLDWNKTTVIAKVSHHKSGRWMEIASNQPGVQFYTSNSMPDPLKNQMPINGKGGAKYTKHGALCLETQKYPDAPNHENFPSILLNPGELYSHEVIYKFGACKADCNAK